MILSKIIIINRLTNHAAKAVFFFRVTFFFLDIFELDNELIKDMQQDTHISSALFLVIALFFFLVVKIKFTHYDRSSYSTKPM